MATETELTAVFGRSGHTQALGEQMVLPDGTVISRLEVSPIIGAYRRMIRNVEFDISELAPVSYLIAKSAGAPFTALPVFLGRSFHHGDVVVRSDSGIRVPKDIEGKRFGVRAYSVTAGVWVRDLLARQYGLDLGKVEWVVDDEDHVLNLDLPANVTRLPEGSSIADAFAAGEIHVALRGMAGVGRTGSPRRGWSSTGIAAREGSDYRALIEDAPRAAAADYRASGVYPIHGVVVLKDDTVKQNPKLPRMLFDAFQSAKEEYLAALTAGKVTDDAGEKYLRQRQVVEGDPLPYGLAANLRSIESLVRSCTDQGLLPAGLALSSLFYNLDR